MINIPLPPDKNNLPTAAQAYAAHFIAVFPLHTRGKTPLTQNGFKDACKDSTAISSWWAQSPEANIGIPTGIINSFWALDIDPRHDGENTLRALEQEYGALPQTVEVITGGGGRHLYFTLPAQGVIKNSAGRLGQGLDVRGDGGYIVAPPSIHESGRTYAFSVDSGENIAPAPEWLLALVQKPEAQEAFTPVSEWRDIVKGVTEGQRNDTLARIAGKLLRCGLDAFVSLELCLAWNDSRCKPPLGHAEVIAVVNSIAGRELARRGV
ncbi:MAG: bifunctional DNA primase/polymerase [Proteobacteria bacterium]|nr:bifunctional DNA primase/polymerase [Pseudomonadota bacterium]